MRVGIIALQHESNTFLPQATGVDDFARDVLAVGDDVARVFESAHHEVGGFFAGLRECGLTAVPIFAARAVPGGVIAAPAGRRLVEMMAERLDRAGPLDGLLVAPHGAAVAEDEPDFDGHWLETLRQRVGPDVPIVCTLDLHANVSQRMIDACDATIAYRTNPHLDQRQRGIEGASLIARTLAEEIHPVQAFATPPVAINIERQLTAEPPCSELFALADRQLQHPGVLGNSAVLGFPYADVPEMGSSFIAITNGDRALAQSLADELANYVIAHHGDFAGRLIGVETALAMLETGDRPVCLLDTGDNVGGGSPGDGTVLLHALRARSAGRVFAKIRDPDSVETARSAGAGRTVELSIGGKTDDRHGRPFEAEATVRGLFDGRWSEPEVRHGGAAGGEMGPCAVVEAGAFVILLTTHRVPPFSLGPLRACGIDPSRFDLLIAKGVHAPVAAYAPVCRRLIRVNTPGVTDADMTRLPFSHRRRPMFPFEAINPHSEPTR